MNFERLHVKWNGLAAIIYLSSFIIVRDDENDDDDDKTMKNYAIHSYMMKNYTVVVLKVM